MVSGEPALGCAPESARSSASSRSGSRGSVASAPTLGWAQSVRVVFAQDGGVSAKSPQTAKRSLTESP